MAKFVPMLAERVSRLAAHYPDTVGRAIAGRHGRLAVVAYHVMEATVDDIASWAQYAGDPEGTTLPIPRLYRKEATTIAHAEAFADFHAKCEHARPAVAWALGDAVMAAVVSDERPQDFFGEDFTYGMRIGGGNLQTTMGLLDRGTRTLLVPEGAVSEGPVHDFPNDLTEQTVY